MKEWLLAYLEVTATLAGLLAVVIVLQATRTLLSRAILGQRGLIAGELQDGPVRVG